MKHRITAMCNCLRSCVRTQGWMCAVMVSLAMAGGALAQMTPKAFSEVGITERLGDQLPLDLAFQDDEGNTVTLGDYFEPGRPVILTLNYYTCPMLCHLTLEGLVEGMRGLQWNAGEEFSVLTVSINPNETPRQAMAFKNAYMAKYDRDGADAGWNFLVGSEENIAQLADAVGFHFKYDAVTGEYAHSASITFVTPSGVISRYMNDIMFEPRDLRLAMIEASQGAIGSPMDRLLLFTCFQWDPNANSYVAAAQRIMMTGGALTVVILASGLFVLWLRGGKHDSYLATNESESSNRTRPEADDINRNANSETPNT